MTILCRRTIQNEINNSSNLHFSCFRFFLLNFHKKKDFFSLLQKTTYCNDTWITLLVFIRRMMRVKCHLSTLNMANLITGKDWWSLLWIVLLQIALFSLAFLFDWDHLSWIWWQIWLRVIKGLLKSDWREIEWWALSVFYKKVRIHNHNIVIWFSINIFYLPEENLRTIDGVLKKIKSTFSESSLRSDWVPFCKGFSSISRAF